MIEVQNDTRTEPIQVRHFYQEREKYRNYPPFQRDRVWGIRKKQGFIDSLLRGLLTLEYLLMEDGSIFQIIDGQQRLEATIEFVENGFPTMTEKEARGRFFLVTDPVAPGCTFSELHPESQRKLMDYRFRFTKMGKESEDILEEIFLRINENEPLSIGERLFVRNSRARHLALDLLAHPFWQNVYKGKVLHKEAFQSAFMLIAIEALSFPLNLRVYGDDTSPMYRLTLGDLDSELTETFKHTVWLRLTHMEHLFSGTNIVSKTDVIPAYEATVFLDECDYDLLRSDEGCLKDWYNQAKRGTVHERLQRKLHFRQMDYLTIQKAFWSIHAEAVQHQEGLRRK